MRLVKKYGGINRGNKILMSMMKSKLLKQKNPNEDALGMLMAFDEPVDFADKENIKDLVAYARRAMGLKEKQII